MTITSGVHPTMGALSSNDGTAENSLSTTLNTRNLQDWADLMWNLYGGLEVATQDEQSFEGVLIRRSLDRLLTVMVRVSPQVFRQSTTPVECPLSGFVFVTMVVEGRVTVIQDGRSCTLGPGDFTFIVDGSPHTVIVETPSQLIDFAWPQDALGLSADERRAVTARPFRSTSPMGRWLSPALIGLYEMDGGVSPSGAIRIADGISNLIVTAALELADPDDPTHRWRRQYDEMIKFIEHNLDDLALSVDSIAENFFMSTRSVHRLFAKFDTTVASTVRDLRLETARRMMLSPSQRTKSVSFIASQLGFSSLQVFSRAFTAKYGVGPKHYRESHQ